MDPKRLVRISKFLSKHLRHSPEALGLELEPGGWVRVNDLLAGAARAGMNISPADLLEVVENNDKQRFALDDSGERIRANQGHSVEVDLQLELVEPPEVLYHGTSESRVAAILHAGLSRMARHHVHLSETVPTATAVGARHGKPVVLTVAAGAMHQAGLTFYRSANGVWLTDTVPPQFLSRT